jgi:hypothetical protein
MNTLLMEFRVQWQVIYAVKESLTAGKSEIRLHVKVVAAIKPIAFFTRGCRRQTCGVSNGIVSPSITVK